MLERLLAINLFVFFLVFARAGALIMLLPGFAGAFVSVRIRLMMAMAVSFAMTPLVAPLLPPPPASPGAAALLILGESVVGAFLGAIVRTLMAALQAAGTFISYFASLANALIQDPIAEAQSSTIAGFLSTTGLVLVFVTDLHHLMFRALVDSYELFPTGALLPVGDFSTALARAVAESLVIGLKLSTPVLIVGLTYYVGIGILGRLMPQLPVFFFGLPLQITVQIYVVVLTLSAMMMVYIRHFAEGLGAYVAP